MHQTVRLTTTSSTTKNVAGWSVTAAQTRRSRCFQVGWRRVRTSRRRKSQVRGDQLAAGRPVAAQGLALAGVQGLEAAHKVVLRARRASR